MPTDLCRCGHPRSLHMPYRRAAACEAGPCPCRSFRRPWRDRLAALLGR